jgi:hypothetical protein
MNSEAYDGLPLRSTSSAFVFNDGELIKCKFGPPKSRERALEKGKQDWLKTAKYTPPKLRYCLTDLLRATFCFADPMILAFCAELLLFFYGVEVVRIVNRMDDADLRQPPNIAINVTLEGGLICELQFILRDVLQVKKTLHKYYEVLRARNHTSLLYTLFDWKKEDPMGDPTHDAARLWVINRKQMARAAVLEQVSARRRKEQWNKQSEQKLADAISKLLEVVDMDQNKMVSLDEFFFAMTVLADQFGLHDIDGQAAMQEKFRQADTDNNGGVSYAEFCQYIRDCADATRKTTAEKAKQIDLARVILEKRKDREDKRQARNSVHQVNLGF